MNSGVGPRLRVVVLAAGVSVRFGGVKALARIRGQSLLRRTLACASAVAGPAPIVVVPPRSAQLSAEGRGSGARFVVNRHRLQGLSTSLRTGLRAARYATAVLILPVDLAWLQGADLARLIRRWRAAPRRIVARREGVRAAIPLILPKSRFAAGLLVHGDTGLRGHLASLPGSARVLVDLPSAAFDVDTRADLRRARARRGQGGACGTRR
jgi:CTP:molybdopterin cytidylyltransferase MocA